LLSEFFRIFGLAHAHQDNLKPCAFNAVFCAVQLHGLFPAEGSSEVTKEDEDQGSVFPLLTETLNRSIRKKDLGIVGFFIYFCHN
jgi:hypothetical protein